MSKIVISEDTRVTIGVIVLVIGGIVWLTELHTLAQSNQKELEKNGDIVRNINERLARIEGGVEELKKITRGE